jgi:hypothetical protein
MMQSLRRPLFFIDNLYFIVTFITFFVYFLYSIYIFLVYINGNYGRIEKT